MPRDWKGGTASTFMTIGASNHASHERAEKDYYATEPAATDWLCRLEQFKSPILEPSCGEGHISEQLKAHGYDVVSRDLEDRGYGEVGRDFLCPDIEPWSGDIITNPPYAFAQEFVERALAMIEPGRKVAMFLKLTFLEGKKRREFFKNAPPHSHLGKQQPIEVRHERRLREYGRQCHGLRMVRVGERLHGASRSKMV